MATSSKPPFLIRFGGKRLRKFVDNELSAAKRDVIATSCFADLARISRFHVPEELLEWVVMNIDPKLREYRHKVSKPIVFTRDMMMKVFNVPSGDKPVERLKNTDHTELRNMYRDGERAPIAYLEKLLHDCADDDVVMINRSFALLAFASVLFLGTNNMVPLDYLGSLLDMDRVREYAWDETILAYCMDQVAEFQEKRRLQKEFMKQNPSERLKQFSIGSCLPALVIFYVDNLDFPVEQVHGHVFDYSLPRALHVCNADFELAMAIDRNKKTLELSVFGKRHPAPQLPHVAQSHIAPNPPHVAQAQPVLQPPHVAQAQPAPQTFAEVDASVNGSEAFVEPVPTEFNALYEKHKAMFKREVNAALSPFGLMVQGIQCNWMALLLKDVSDASRNDSVQEGTNESNGINFDVPNLDPEAGFRAGVSMGGVGSSPAAAAIIEEASVGIGGANNLDVASDLIAAEFHQVEKTIDELTSGPSTHKKRTRHKRVAVDFDSSPKMKKVKVNADADALYTKYVLHKQKTKKLKEGESHSPCFKIGGFFSSYENWQASLRPRGDLDNEVMALYIEHFNLSHKSSRKCKKYAFSCLMSDLLSVNPARFLPSINCLREFNRVCDDFKAHKSDLLYFTIVKDHHWILCTINMLHKKINIFDSMKSSKTSEIANFATLVKQTKIIKLDIASFPCVNLDEYPHQKTNFDCGFFVILYMENFDGNIMKMFGQDYIPIFRKIVAATLFNKPTNEIDAAVAIAEQAP
ncbi:hypothetical protein ACQ4PT_036585 [Festuca glaucescens]